MEWKDGGMEEWKNGTRMTRIREGGTRINYKPEEWKSGWKDGKLEEWKRKTHPPGVGQGFFRKFMINADDVLW
jgi:hypothetical protein